jgi:hypothetical protein
VISVLAGDSLGGFTVVALEPPGYVMPNTSTAITALLSGSPSTEAVTEVAPLIRPRSPKVALPFGSVVRRPFGGKKTSGFAGSSGAMKMLTFGATAPVSLPKEIVDGQRLIADSKEPRRNVSRCVADLG